jgi:predicted transcriptional regulator
MSQIERLGRDERLSLATRMVAVEILRRIDPVTGRARVTAEQLAEKLSIDVGTVRNATSFLSERSYFQKVKVGRNVEFVLASPAENESRGAQGGVFGD